MVALAVVVVVLLLLVVLTTLPCAPTSCDLLAVGDVVRLLLPRQKMAVIYKVVPLDVFRTIVVLLHSIRLRLASRSSHRRRTTRTVSRITRTCRQPSRYVG